MGVEEDGDIIAEHIEKLRPTLSDKPVDWAIPLGDNYLAAASWASMLSDDYGVRYGRALDAALEKFWPDRRHPEWE